MPGVPELLAALEDYEHLYPALLTGNYRDAAAIMATKSAVAALPHGVK